MTTTEHRRPSTFGPSALATPANALTLARLLATPVLVVMVVLTGPSSWLLAGVWLVCAGSDGLDGWVARKQGTTRSGAFLDPLADKFLVLGVLAALASIHEVSWLPVVLIGAREFAMSVYRAFAGRRGVSIAARQTAKIKTLLQDLAVGLALIPPVGLHHVTIVRILLWIAVVATLYTGLEYLHDGRRLLAGGGSAAAGGAVGSVSGAGDGGDVGGGAVGPAGTPGPTGAAGSSGLA
ncbi:MAG TPA: CDP-alcohol phosphatidyltransferase family protein [Acidimicrobiales bacterium]|nr:CDP-alcohol phosphatidyltransferase family protein [Acidimicrobiales bacterium]